MSAVWKTIRYPWIQKSFDCFLKCDVHCKENLNTPRYYHTTAACHRKGKLASLLIACDLSMAYLLSCFVPVCVGLTYIWMSLELDWIPYGKKATQTSFKTCFLKKGTCYPPKHLSIHSLHNCQSSHSNKRATDMYRNGKEWNVRLIVHVCRTLPQRTSSYRPRAPAL